MRVWVSLCLMLGFALSGRGERAPAEHGTAPSGRPEAGPTFSPTLTDSERAWERPVSVDQDMYERSYLHFNYLNANPVPGLSPSATLAALEFQSRLLGMGVDAKLAGSLGENFEGALRDRSKINSGERLQEQLEALVSVGSTLLAPKFNLKDLKTFGREFGQLTDAGEKQVALKVFAEVMGFSSGRLDGIPMTAADTEMLKSVLERAAKNPAVQKGLDPAFKKIMGVGQTERLLMVRSRTDYAPYVEKWANLYAPNFKDPTLKKAVAGARNSVSPQKLKEINAATDALIETFRRQTAHLEAEAVRQAKEKLRRDIHDAFSEARSGSQVFSLLAGQIDPQAGKAFTVVSRSAADIAEILTLAKAGDITDIKAAFDITSILTGLLSNILGGPSPDAMILEQLVELRKEVRSLHQDMLKEFSGVHLHLYALERHLNNKFSDLDQIIRSTNSALATVEGKLDLHHAEVKRAFGDERAGELDILMRECPNRSAQIPMDAAYYASCLDKLMACAVTKSRDSISTGGKLIFDGKTANQPGVLEESDSVLGYDSTNWDRLNFLTGAAAHFGKTLTTKALPNPSLWAMCASGYLQMASQSPKHYRLYDPDLSHLKELQAAGDDLEQGLSAITTGAGGKANAFLLKELLGQYHASVNELETHVNTARVQYQHTNLADYDLRLDARQKPLRPIPFDMEEGKPAIKPCEGSWAANSGLPSLVGGNVADTLGVFIPNAVRVGDDISSNGGPTQLKFCYDITEFEFDERPFETPGIPGGSYQPYAKSYQLTVRATFQGNPVFARAISGPIDVPTFDKARYGPTGFLGQISIEHLKANLRNEWTKDGGFLSRLIKESEDSHFSKEYAFKGSDDKASPIPHGLTFRLGPEREIMRNWRLDLVGPSIDASVAGYQTWVNAAKNVHDKFESGRIAVETQIQKEINDGTSKEVKRISGARALLASYLQLGLPMAVRENEKELSSALNNLPSGQTIQTQAGLKPFIWNEVDRLVFDANNPTYPKPPPGGFVRPKAPIDGFLDGIFKEFLAENFQWANRPATPPKEALTRDTKGVAPGDPAAPELTNEAYAAFYKPGSGELVTHLHSRATELENALNQVIAEEPSKLYEHRQHPIVRDWRSELLTAKLALQSGKPYKYKAKPKP